MFRPCFAVTIAAKYAAGAVLSRRPTVPAGRLARGLFCQSSSGGNPDADARIARICAGMLLFPIAPGGFENLEMISLERLLKRCDDVSHRHAFISRGVCFE